MTYIGVDLVYVPGFSEQIEQPGTFFLNNFSPIELIEAKSSVHKYCDTLAGKWAAKESFIKAWSQTLIGHPPLINPNSLKYNEIQIVKDSYNRPLISLSGTILKEFTKSYNDLISKNAKGKSSQFITDFANVLKVSISHDGDYAFAEVIITP